MLPTIPDNVCEARVTHSVPAIAIGNGVDGAGQHDAALVAACRTLPVLHDLPKQTQDTLLTSHMHHTWHILQSP